VIYCTYGVYHVGGVVIDAPGTIHHSVRETLPRSLDNMKIRPGFLLLLGLYAGIVLLVSTDALEKDEVDYVRFATNLTKGFIRRRNT